LADETKNGYDVKVTSPGNPGKFTNLYGYLSYFEVIKHFVNPDIL